jgi:hypothetical protein
VYRTDRVRIAATIFFHRAAFDVYHQQSERPLRSRLPPVESQRMQKRRRFKQTESLEARLAGEVKRLREQAAMLPRGRLREEVERKAVQFEAAYEVAELLRRPQVNATD